MKRTDLLVPFQLSVASKFPGPRCLQTVIALCKVLGLYRKTIAESRKTIERFKTDSVFADRACVNAIIYDKKKMAMGNRW